MSRSSIILGVAFVGLVVLGIAIQLITGSGMVWWPVLIVIGIITGLKFAGLLDSRNSDHN